MLADALVIAGPTAAGKTALALALAQRYDGEIINMDSAIVYQGMDIGTAKPSLQELARIPHYLVNVCDITQSYSAADFARDAEVLVQDIRARGKVPIVAGGTMLYLHSWVNGLSDLPSADADLRAQLQAEWTQDPVACHQRLLTLDPIAGARIHVNDPQRIIRALEVITLTGSPLSSLQQQRQPTRHHLAVVFIMPPSKDWLHARIDQRFDSMLEMGFLQEVKQLYDRGYDANLPALRSVGYRQVWQFFDGLLSYDEMVQQAKQATRSLAKRQLTWLKKMHADIHLDAASDLETQIALIEKNIKFR